MERLTKRMSGISHSTCGNVILTKCENCNDRMPSCYEEDCGVNVEALNRLAAYEDTGLTPEQIHKLKAICKKHFTEDEHYSGIEELAEVERITDGAVYGMPRK